MVIIEDVTGAEGIVNKELEYTERHLLGIGLKGDTSADELSSLPKIEFSSTDSIKQEDAAVVFSDFCVHRFINYIPEFEFSLKIPIHVELKYEKNVYLIECSELAIYVDGETEEEAFLDFYNFFITDYYNWYNSPEAVLTEDAKNLKRKYMEYVDA